MLIKRIRQITTILNNIYKRYDSLILVMDK